MFWRHSTVHRAKRETLQVNKRTLDYLTNHNNTSHTAGSTVDLFHPDVGLCTHRLNVEPRWAGSTMSPKNEPSEEDLEIGPSNLMGSQIQLLQSVHTQNNQ